MTEVVAGVVIVHFGDSELTLRCLESVMGEGSLVNRRVVVVDNAGNLDRRLLGDETLLVTRPDNPGFGAAVNLGIEAIDPDDSCSYYLILNNDATLLEGFLDAAADALETGVGAAGGPILQPNMSRSVWYAGGRINFLTGTAWQKKSVSRGFSRRDVGFIPATALAIWPQAWREIGGFDTKFFLYNEDLDLCLRLRRSGWRLLFEPRMACNHGLGGATGSGDYSPLYLENLTKTRLMPFRSRLYRIYLGGVHTVYNFLRVVRLSVQHGFGAGPRVAAVIRGHVAALGSLFS